MNIYLEKENQQSGQQLAEWIYLLWSSIARNNYYSDDDKYLSSVVRCICYLIDFVFFCEVVIFYICKYYIMFRINGEAVQNSESGWYIYKERYRHGQFSSPYYEFNNKNLPSDRSERVIKGQFVPRIILICLRPLLISIDSVML